MESVGTEKRVAPVTNATIVKWQTALLAAWALSLPFFGFSLLTWGERAVLRPDWVASLGVILCALLKTLHTGRLRTSATSKGVVAVNVAALFSALNLLEASMPQISDFLTKWLQLLLVSTLFFAIGSMDIRKPQVRAVLRVWILTAFLVALYGMYQVLARNLHLPLAYLPVTNPVMGTTVTVGQTFGRYERPSSIFAEPSYLGSYLVSPIVLLVTLAHYRVYELVLGTRVVHWLVLSVLLGALMLSFSLSSYVTVLSFFLISFVSTRRALLSLHRLLAVAGLLIASTTVLAFLGVDFLSAFTRVAGIIEAVRSGTPLVGDASLNTRLARMVVTLAAWTPSPIVGLGLNNVPYRIVEGAPQWFLFKGSLTLASNQNAWIQALAETGLVGLFAWAFLWVSSYRSASRAARQCQDPELRAVLAGFAFAILTDMVDSNFTHEFIHPQRWFDLSMVSLLVSLVGKTYRGEPNAKDRHRGSKLLPSGSWDPREENCRNHRRPWV